MLSSSEEDELVVDWIVVQGAVGSFFWSVSVGYEFGPFQIRQGVDPEIVHVVRIGKASEDVEGLVDNAGAMSPSGRG